MSEGSNINVGNIEENIKIIKNSWLYNDEENVKFVNAIEHLLLDYTRQKQINEEHQKTNGELREKVKELEKENRIFALEGSKVRLSLYIKENYIPRQNIKDKFEKIQLLYENNLKEVDLKELKNISLNIFEGIKLEVERDLLRRLLQESEEK